VNRTWDDASRCGPVKNKQAKACKFGRFREREYERKLLFMPETQGATQAILKILQAEEISTVCGELRVRKHNRVSERSQVAGANGVSQRPVAVVLETVTVAIRYSSNGVREWQAERPGCSGRMRKRSAGNGS